MRTQQTSKRTKPVFVAFVYCGFSALWIVLSDRLLTALHLSSTAQMYLGMAKGSVYVLVSGSLIYLAFRRLAQVNEGLENLVSSRTIELEQNRFLLQTRANILKNLIEAVPVGLAMFDEQMRYVEVSKRWCEDFGLQRSEIIGKSHYKIFPTLPERWKEVHRRSLAGEIVRNDADSFTDNGGKEHWLRWETRPWRDGQSAGILIFSEDITDRRLLERQLLQARKMEAVGRLAGGIAHDFNNLLMIIQASAEVLKQESRSNEQVFLHADRIAQASDSATAVTSQLLAFSRRQPQNLEYVDIDLLLVNFCKMLPTLLGEDIEFILDPSPTKVAIHVDRSQFEQIIMNLVINARDSMPMGGRLTIRTSVVSAEQVRNHRGTVDIPSGKFIELSIADSGCGMDVQTQEHIFEPFFTTKPIGKGTGLGLSTVYGIVKQHNGFVWVCSEIRQGTTFRIYLPAFDISKVTIPDSSHPASVASRTAGSLKKQAKPTILVVEDQLALREVMTEYLQKRGFNVLTAENGKSALALVANRTEPIHVLLTDVVMPGIRGTDLAREVCKKYHQTKVIIMSGYPGDVVERDRIPGAMFVQKPIGLSVLAEKITTAVSDE